MNIMSTAFGLCAGLEAPRDRGGLVVADGGATDLERAFAVFPADAKARCNEFRKASSKLGTDGGCDRALC